MFMGLPSLLDWFIVASVFALVLALWFICILIWSVARSSSTRRIERRLSSDTAQGDQKRVLRLWHDGQEATTTVSGNRHSRILWRRLDQLVREAGWDPSIRIFIVILVFLTMTGCPALTRALLDNSLLGAGIGVAVMAIFWTYLGRRAAHRTALFDRQFIDALELAARSLRAGHPLSGAFRLVADEFGDPVGTIFSRICQQQDLGESIENALRREAAICSSTDLKLLATSVVIQLRSGGNLADMMERATFVIRDRTRLNRRVRVLTAQTQFSKRILLSLPFITFVLLNLINPAYMKPLYDTQPGKLLLLLGIGGMVFGTWLMNRLSVLKY